ncbi:threonylcarbamoyl-AMP synthase [Leptospira ognonensis]|uniref:Threonylcarbamoyl-AMP synthase n=1 Tax=Leptospira ognonensis TaxID=2484945 RepID=A0A4R9KBA6_9LEPT|nr:L-threonylcarbamoyladenylate synthase [Leptospira ognonensis]TGL63994.1 threonylcarbamoyl-AMP synthase [Leptospira ognonensis]
MDSTLVTDDTAILGRILAKGGIVVFPTETVYGIGADSTNFEACRRIYQIKNRPLDNPLIAHFDSLEQIEEYCFLSDVAIRLLNHFSPGPLTLVLRKKSESIFTLGLDTLAVRIPSHTGCLDLIRAAGVPISAPSANPSGKPSYTRESDVITYFMGKVDGILQSTEPVIGIESTVVDLSREIPILLRPGQISKKDLAGVLPMLTDVSDLQTEKVVRSPGTKYRHYSPEAKVMVLNEKEFRSLWEVKQNDDVSAFIGFHIDSKRSFDKNVANNREYMKFLYSFFTDADKAGRTFCYCQEPIADEDFEALMNRLSKAESKN